MERKSPHQPDFEPDVITLLDWIQKAIRRQFFGRIAGGGGLYRRIVFCLVLAYLYPY